MTQYVHLRKYSIEIAEISALAGYLDFLASCPPSSFSIYLEMPFSRYHSFILPLIFPHGAFII